MSGSTFFLTFGLETTDYHSLTLISNSHSRRNSQAKARGALRWTPILGPMVLSRDLPMGQIEDHARVVTPTVPFDADHSSVAESIPDNLGE